MLKPYDELRKVDVSPYTEQRDKVDYLPWNVCMDLLHKHGAESVYFLPVQNPKNGSSLYETDTVFKDKSGVENRCYETRIEIHIDDKVYYMQSPVMNGSNPVKDNSMSQQRVWNSMTRSFVKGVAIYTGLGFDLWLKEEHKERNEQYQADVYHDIKKVKDRVFETITAIQQRSGMSLGQIAEKLNKSEEELRTYLKYYDFLGVIEYNLTGLLNSL